MDDRLTFRGDALEVLTEYLMKVTPVANNSGLSNFKVVPLRNDYGVDAYGDKNGVRVVVQCKFRSNPTDLVHYADLARTFTQGVLMYKLDPAQNKNLWLVTSSLGANHQSQKVLGKKLHVLGYQHLSKNLDGNVDFWAGLNQSV